ncbi:hypothetical protein P3S68_021816 [Capsicum galapagoense]
MEKASSILFSLIFMLILLGSPSCMASGQGKACQSVKDCFTLFCKHEHPVCLEGHCICKAAPKYMASDDDLGIDIVDLCHKDSDCKAICGPEWSSIKCIDGICVCKNPN